MGQKTLAVVVPMGPWLPGMVAPASWPGPISQLRRGDEKGESSRKARKGMKKETDGDEEKGLKKEKSGRLEEQRHTKTGREEKEAELGSDERAPAAVSYTHLTLPTIHVLCRSRWSPYH